MFALHWISALTLALAICLSAKPVKRDAEELLEIITTFKLVIEDVECPGNIRLYSPSDIKEDCMSSAWNCTFIGLSDLQSKCNITKGDPRFDAYDNVLTGLNSTKINITTQPSPDCLCKNYKQTDVEQFLDNLKVQVQRLGSG